jgi:hypothetical protein
VKYGVANPGGSDLLGWCPIKITPQMVGKTIAAFMAVEVKATKNSPVTKEQVAFLDAVYSSGGIAVLATHISDVETKVKKARGET